MSRAALLLLLPFFSWTVYANPLEQAISKSDCYREKSENRYYPNRKWTQADEECIEKLMIRKKVRVKDLFEYDGQRKAAACIYLRMKKSGLKCNVLHEVHPPAVFVPELLRAKDYKLVNPKHLLKICKAQYTVARCNEVCKMHMACAFPQTDRRAKQCREAQVDIRNKYGEMFLYRAKAAEQGSLKRECVPPQPRTSMKK